MPEWRTEIRRRLAGTKLRAEREAEIVDEVAQHLDDRYRELTDKGLAPDTATAAVLRELDEEGVLAREVAKSEPVSRPLPPVGAPARGSILVAIWQDLRYTVRRLAKQPLFAATAIATVALTVGPATAVIGVADALFFQMPTGITAPGRLFVIHFARSAKAGSYSPWSLSYAHLNNVQARSRTIAGLSGQQPLTAGLSVGNAQPRRVDGQGVAANYFDLLGVRMSAGRGLLPEEDATPGGVTSTVLSSAVAREVFGSDQAAMGQSILLNGIAFSVVGVADSRFEGTIGQKRAGFWVTGRAIQRVRHLDPTFWTYAEGRGPFYEYIARLAPGATVADATAELDVLTKGLPDATASSVKLQPGFGAPPSTNRNGFKIVSRLGIACAALVLLGIANMANLLIFRGLKLSREVAIRKALGASAGRIIQLTLVESLVLSFAGAALGVGLALGIKALLADFTIWGVGAMQVPIDWRVLAATSALAVLIGVAFGTGPAVIAARGRTAGALGRGVRENLPRAGRLRQALAAMQLAVSLTLLVGALLFLGTLRNLRAIDLGFDPKNVTTMMTDLKSRGYSVPEMWAFYKELTARLQAQPGIEAVGIGYTTPLGGLYTSRLYLPGQDPKAASEIAINYASPGYFEALRIPIRRGRTFTDAESFTATDATVVILSETAARRLFGDSDPLGQVVVEPGRPAHDYVVVGVTGDARWSSLTAPAAAGIYLPFSPGIAVTGASVIARSSRPPADARKILQTAAASIDPSTPLFRDQTMERIIDTHIAEQRLFAWVLSLLGVTAFILAAVGLYGLVSQMVSERAREFGIRLAVGAGRGDILSLLVRQAALVTAAGIAIGLTTAALSGKLIEASLFGVTSRDPFVYASAAGLLLLVVALALIGPARAALGVQPISVLRSE